jgi:hypothetical protein
MCCLFVIDVVEVLLVDGRCEGGRLRFVAGGAWTCPL